MPGWWFDTQAGGGWLGASGSHIVDQVRVTLGEFASLSAALPIVSAREGVAEDSYVLRFQLTNAVEGIMQQTAGAWGPSASMTRAREGLSFRRVIDIPFGTCVAALDSWQRTARDHEPRIGGSRLRGPIEHDRDSGTCRT